MEVETRTSKAACSNYAGKIKENKKFKAAKKHLGHYFHVQVRKEHNP